MFCQNCGKENKSGSAFCAFCGTKLPEESLQANETQLNEILPDEIPAEEIPLDDIQIDDAPAAVSSDGIQPEDRPTVMLDQEQVRAAEKALNGDTAVNMFDIPQGEPIEPQPAEPKKKAGKKAGAKKDRENMTGAPQDGGKKSGLKSTLALIIMLAAAVVLTVVLVSVVKKTYGPEAVARRFMESMTDEEWGAAYSCLDAKALNGDLLSRDAFVTARNVPGGFDYNAKVRDVIKKDGGLKTATVRVKLRAEGRTMKIDLDLVRRGFTWKVVPDVDEMELVCEDLQVRVPEGSKLSMDGIPVTVSPKDDDGMDLYTIPEAFGDTHYLSVTGEGKEEQTYCGRIPSKKNEEEPLTIRMRFGEKALESAAKQAAADYQEILKAAVSGASAEDVKAIADMDPTNKDSVIESYEELRDTSFDWKYEDFWKVIKLELSSNEYEVYNDYDANNCIRVTIQSEYALTESFQNGSPSTSDDSTDATLVYVQDGDGWKLFEFHRPYIW